MARVINPASGRVTLGYSPAPQPRPKAPQQKKCTTLECQISAIRSQTAVWDLSLKTATGELLAALQKKRMML